MRGKAGLPGFGDLLRLGRSLRGGLLNRSRRRLGVVLLQRNGTRARLLLPLHRADGLGPLAVLLAPARDHMMKEGEDTEHQPHQQDLPQDQDADHRTFLRLFLFSHQIASLPGSSHRGNPRRTSPPPDSAGSDTCPDTTGPGPRPQRQSSSPRFWRPPARR